MFAEYYKTHTQTHRSPYEWRRRSPICVRASENLFFFFFIVDFQSSRSLLSAAYEISSTVSRRMRLALVCAIVSRLRLCGSSNLLAWLSQSVTGCVWPGLAITALVEWRAHTHAHAHIASIFGIRPHPLDACVPPTSVVVLFMSNNLLNIAGPGTAQRARVRSRYAICRRCLAGK